MGATKPVCKCPLCACLTDFVISAYTYFNVHHISITYTHIHMKMNMTFEFGCIVASRRTLVDFLSTAITSFNREEEDSSKAPPEDREEAVQISEGLGSSRQGTSSVRMDQSIIMI